jgi:hypothetical protein
MFARSGPTHKSHAPMTKLKFYFRLLHPKAIAGKADGHFFFLLASSLIF